MKSVIPKHSSLMAPDQERPKMANSPTYLSDAQWSRRPPSLCITRRASISAARASCSGCLSSPSSAPRCGSRGVGARKQVSVSSDHGQVHWPTPSALEIWFRSPEQGRKVLPGGQRARSATRPQALSVWQEPPGPAAEEEDAGLGRH